MHSYEQVNMEVKNCEGAGTITKLEALSNRINVKLYVN